MSDQSQPADTAGEAVAWVSRTVLARLAESDKGCETANLWKSQPTKESVALYAHPRAEAPSVVGALEMARAFIIDQYSCAESSALAGDPISEEARPVRDALCAALAALSSAEGQGSSSALDHLIDEAFDAGPQQPAYGPLTPEPGANSPDNGGSAAPFKNGAGE